jgi:hypothetical protein
MSDRFYNQIIRGLNGTLDPEIFQSCATDLLRDAFPGLAPIGDGADGGMDGAVADGEGEPFPLIATIRDDVIGNMTKNLKSRLSAGDTRRKVILATSQKLTPKRRANLLKRASDFGFTLQGVFEQQAIADRLYHSPRWCMELLNLAGTPPALSAIPKSARPYIDIPLLGRANDLAWLEGNENDRLLVGQPGVGKTFLLRKFVERSGGLFVVSNDITAIINCLREEQPNTIIMDDAHITLGLLSELRHLREVTGGQFTILASCWPGDEDEIARILGLSKSQIHYLDLLSRDEITEIVRVAGLIGPPELIYEIVNQAEGRPGLAITLVDLCLKGDLDEIIRGEALTKSVLHTFEKIVGPRVSSILAAFSLGGDAGVKMTLVARELGLPLVDLQVIVTRLATGGIVFEVGREFISIRPPALRDALVRDVFFRGAASLPVLERIVAEAPRTADVVNTLIGASARGALIPNETLQRMVEDVDSDRVWVDYARLGKDQATWILRNHPEKLLSVARVLLEFIPEDVIPLLLEKAEGDGRQLHSTPDHPLRLIQGWVCAGRPGTGEPVRRREVLFKGMEPRIRENREVGVTLHGIRIFLSPGYEEIIAEPGSGNTFSIRSGYISFSEMRAIRSKWPDILKTLEALRIEDSIQLRDVIEDWAYPRRTNVGIPSEIRDFKRDFAAEMVHDVSKLLSQHLSVVVWASRIAKDLKVDVVAPPDADFCILFPGRGTEDSTNWREGNEKHVVAIREMAAEWAIRDPSSVANRLAYLEHEAIAANVTWPRCTPHLCTEIAQLVDLPLVWARLFIIANLAPDLVAPFISIAYRKQDPMWSMFIEECLSHSVYRWAAIPFVLTLDRPPEAIVTKILNSLSGAGNLIKHHCIRGEVPIEMIARLLKHEDPAIAAAAAYGEWEADPKATVRPALLADWQEAVLRSSDEEEYWLEEVFVSDPSLAYEWLRHRLPEFIRKPYGRDIASTIAVRVLGADQRRSLLLALDRDSWSAFDIVFQLIDDDLNLYRELLGKEEFKAWHLIPLSGNPVGPWIEKARLALSTGYQPIEIANAVYGYPVMTVEWVGKESATWKEWISKFDALLSHDDPAIRSIGEAGKVIAEQRMSHALEEERNEAIYGIEWRLRHT